MFSPSSEPAVSRVSLFALPALSLRSGQGVSWLAYVGLAEQEKAASFSHPDEALAFAAQHTLMRVLAAQLLGVRPTSAADIPVDRSCLLCGKSPSHGKPKIEGVNFSMARSLGLAAGAVAGPGVSLGVDLVQLRGNYYDSFDALALAPYEKRVVKSLTKEQAQLVRHLLWVGKEAVLKATGHGLALAPAQVMFSLPPLPQTLEEAQGLTAQARVLFPTGAGDGEGQPETDQQAASFWVTWQVLEGKYLLAVASDQPHELTSHLVASPIEVRRGLEADGFLP